MYLQRLEIQGFKSFAQKTTLEFLPPRDGRAGVTAVVGPNGSGKSNVADAIRWVLGEQSLKLLRGKKTEDVIFSGTDKKARMGFAEVTLVLNNEDGTIEPLANEEASVFDYSEIAITRRVYRSGESEYLLNNNRVRLADIQLLLARAHFAEKSYTVIGQGMIDHMLAASAAERKQFFDEAAGIKEFQIKRHHTVLKLHATRENLHETKMLLQEIEPRLQSLTRQVKRLEKREEVEQELHTKYVQYYGAQWANVNEQYSKAKHEFQTYNKMAQAVACEYEESFGKVRDLEKQESQGDTFTQLQREYDLIYSKRSKVREDILRLKNAVEVAKLRAQNQQKWTPLPLTKIIAELEVIRDEVQSAAAKEEMGFLKQLVKKMMDRVAGLIERLQQPAPEKTEFIDTQAQLDIEELEKTLVILDSEAKELQERIAVHTKEEQEKKSAFFAIQRDLQERQRLLHESEQRASGASVALARVETRREALLEEITREVPQFKEEILAIEHGDPSVDTAYLQDEVYRLRRQLELIGSIDPEVMKEYEETNERYTFLSTQVQDLESAMASIERGIEELDVIMTRRRETAFAAINTEFDRIFRILFNGGKAAIVEVKQQPKSKNPVEHAEDSPEDQVVEELEEELDDAAQEELVGIDIHATPPGKRIKDIAILSGGERALTSVALICAILATNPSPFVVLDEVDAALDESNSIRFAQILGELADKTQFIAITHNRATMEQGHVLYGVTMGEDGVSRILSVRLEDAVAHATK